MEENKENETENNVSIISEIEAYKNKLIDIQNKINELNIQRENLYKMGLRIEGILEYLHKKASKSA